MFCIVLNIISMAMAYEGSSVEYQEILKDINYGFTSVFIFECALKLIAYGYLIYNSQNV